MKKLALLPAIGVAVMVTQFARADVRDDIRACGRNDAQCVGLALVSYMDQQFERLAILIARGGGGGGSDASDGRDDGSDGSSDGGGGDGGGGGGHSPVLAAGLYTLQTTTNNVCASLDVQPRLSAGILRRVDLTCFPGNQAYRLECSNGASCSDASGNILEAYDDNVIDVTIGGRYAVYQYIPNLYDGAVRVNASSILEIFHAGEWRGVCDDGFTDAAGQVACRQLGRTYVGYSMSQTGSGAYWLDDVVCSGTEANLAACQHGAWGAHNCGANEAVALRCQ